MYCRPARPFGRSTSIFLLRICDLRPLRIRLGRRRPGPEGRSDDSQARSFHKISPRTCGFQCTVLLGRSVREKNMVPCLNSRNLSNNSHPLEIRIFLVRYPGKVRRGKGKPRRDVLFHRPARIIHVGCVEHAQTNRWCVSQANVVTHSAFPNGEHSACVTHRGAAARFTHPTRFMTSTG